MEAWFLKYADPAVDGVKKASPARDSYADPVFMLYVQMYRPGRDVKPVRTTKNGGERMMAVQPNFLFVFMDDMGWRDLACTGSTFYETPNIDRLCRQGMVFANSYASCPYALRREPAV